MSQVSSVIGDRLAQIVRAARETGPLVRCVLVGPPDDVLDAVFARLTGDGQHDWSIDAEAIPVVLIPADDRSDRAAGVLSAVATWDYAIAMRDSYPVSLVLSSRTRWDTVPESISNAALIVGEPTGVDIRREPWLCVVSAIEGLGQVPRSTIVTTLGWMTKERAAGRSVSPDPEWEFAEAVLSGQSYPFAAGVPFVPSGGSPRDFGIAVEGASGALQRIVDRVAEEGLADAEAALVSEAAALPAAADGTTIAVAVKEMLAHVASQAGSGLAFGNAPHSYFRPIDEGTAWWRALRPSVLDELVPPRRRPRGSGKLTLSVKDRLLSAGSIAIVRDVVAIHISIDAAGVPSAPANATVSRLRPSPYFYGIATVAADGEALAVVDVPPAHARPMIYRVAADDLAASVKVVALDTFAIGGLLYSPGSAVELPRRDRAVGNVQELPLPQSGDRQLRLLAGSRAVKCVIRREDELIELDVTGGVADLTLPLNHGDSLEVTLFDETGSSISAWTAVTVIEGGPSKAPSSEWSRLILEHSDRLGGSAAPRAPYVPLRDLEQRLVGTTGHPDALLACWSDAIGGNPGTIGAGSTIGDRLVPPEYDGRPHAPDLPARFEDAGSRVGEILAARRLPLPELALCDSELIGAITEYAASYLDWLRADTDARWAGIVALHVVVPSTRVVSTQPVAILVPPTHPMKLAWHANAQSVLRAALETKPRCPLATAIDPAASPGITTLELRRGDTREQRVFVAAPSGDPYWSLLINQRDIANSEVRVELNRVLGWLHLAPEDVAGGLSASQTVRALDEMVGMTPTRSLLRVGLVSGSNGSGPVADALLDWAATGLAHAADRVDQVTGPVSSLTRVDVFDYRPEPTNPGAAALADAAVISGEELLWMRRNSRHEDRVRPDLTLMEDIELTNLELESRSSRSLLGRGAIARIDLREDPGDATWVSESRTSAHRASDDESALSGLAAAIVSAFEAPLGPTGATHLRFEPNQQRLQAWVNRSRFVAASSTQLDPACFVRGAHAGLLWDFDIPANSPDAAGYYLIASRDEAVAQAVRRGLDLPDGVEIRPILDEVSRRGIPILRRLAAGGNQARGELGMLLGSRLLQDAFRPKHGEVVLPPAAEGVVTMLLPVDPYRALLDTARKALLPDASDKRADLIAFTICRAGDRVRLGVRPVEIKNRPGMQPAELADALGQAQALGRLAAKLWSSNPVSELWDLAARSFLAKCLDHCFRLYADVRVHGVSPEAWRQLHQDTITSVLGGADLGTTVSINPGRVIAFRDALQSTVADMDADDDLDTIIVGKGDRDALLGEEGVSTALASLIRPLFAMPSVDCHGGSDGPSTPTTTNSHAVGSGLSPAGTEDAPPTETDEDAAPAAQEEPGADREPVTFPAEPAPRGDGEAGGWEVDAARVEAASETEDGEDADELPDRTVSTTSPVTPEARARVRAAFDGFIGNEAAVAQVSRDLLAASLSEPPRLSRNILFVGPPSVGKTEIARRISRALGLPFLRLDGPSLQSRDRLFSLLDEQLEEAGAATVDEGVDAGARVLRYPPFVVFVDEVHLVSRPAQESLLTLLEPRDRQARIGDRVVRVPDATFLFATTRPQRIDAALRSRCVRIDLEPYSAPEVARMVADRVRQEHPDVRWDDEVYLRLAYLSRLVPRASFELAEDLWKEMVVTEEDRTPVEHLEAVRRGRGIDPRGLRPQDFRYLTILDRAGRPIGEESLAAQLGVDADEVVDEIEPTLIRMNLIMRGRGGREITPQGRTYLAEHRLGNSS